MKQLTLSSRRQLNTITLSQSVLIPKELVKERLELDQPSSADFAWASSMAVCSASSSSASASQSAVASLTNSWTDLSLRRLPLEEPNTGHRQRPSSSWLSLLSEVWVRYRGSIFLQNRYCMPHHLSHLGQGFLRRVRQRTQQREFVTQADVHIVFLGPGYPVSITVTHSVPPTHCDSPKLPCPERDFAIGLIQRDNAATKTRRR